MGEQGEVGDRRRLRGTVVGRQCFALPVFNGILVILMPLPFPSRLYFSAFVLQMTTSRHGGRHLENSAYALQELFCDWYVSSTASNTKARKGCCNTQKNIAVAGYKPTYDKILAPGVVERFVTE